MTIVHPAQSSAQQRARSLLIFIKSSICLDQCLCYSLIFQQSILQCCFNSLLLVNVAYGPSFFFLNNGIRTNHRSESWSQFCVCVLKHIFSVLMHRTKLTRVCHSIGAVGWALGVRRDHRRGSSHGLDSGGYWVDGESGWGWTRSSWLYHGHLSSLLALGVWRYPLAISWFGGWKTPNC